MKHLLFAIICLFSLFANAQFVEEKRISDPDTDVSGQQMQLLVMDAKTGTPLQADVRVEGLLRKSVVLPSVSDTTFAIKTYRLFNVSCVLPGYMYFAHKFWPDETSLHVEKVGMRPLEIGLKTDVRDVTFLGDKTEIYSKSTEGLDEIVTWMNLNPTVHIAVIGHVNGPGEKNSKFFQKASLDRAQSVMEYLIKKGISKERLTARGAGNSEMIYPKPQTDWQSDANRRIEIEITAL